MCIMCDLEEINQTQLAQQGHIEPAQPGLLEYGTVGLGVAFSMWAMIALLGGLATLVVRYQLGTISLVVSLTVGFLAGVWARLRVG